MKNQPLKEIICMKTTKEEIKLLIADAEERLRVYDIFLGLSQQKLPREEILKRLRRMIPEGDIRIEDSYLCVKDKYKKLYYISFVHNDWVGKLQVSVSNWNIALTHANRWDCEKREIQKTMDEAELKFYLLKNQMEIYGLGEFAKP